MFPNDLWRNGPPPVWGEGRKRTRRRCFCKFDLCFPSLPFLLRDRVSAFPLLSSVSLFCLLSKSIQPQSSIEYSCIQQVQPFMLAGKGGRKSVRYGALKLFLAPIHGMNWTDFRRSDLTYLKICYFFERWNNTHHPHPILLFALRHVAWEFEAFNQRIFCLQWE